MFNSDLVQPWSAMVPIPAIELIELGMATVGRFLPFSVALPQRAVMLLCMRRESASFRHSRLYMVPLTGKCTGWGSQGGGSSSVSDEGIRRAVGIQPCELRLHPQDRA